MITRFAPSPTGHLHLGHLLNAIYVWRQAGRAGGIVRLRIEDHDRERSRREFERSILDDLEWLGFVPDVPSIAALRAGPCDGRRSDHLERYEQAHSRLAGNGRVYGCACSRAETVARLGGSAPLAPGGALAGARGEAAELRYDGFCRNRGLQPGPGIGTRVRLDPGVETFVDGMLGPQSQEPATQCGDLLVRDRLGNWTYQFAVTVDDMVEEVTDVIRGRDLLASTGRQIQLARLLGRAVPPAFLHHPLILGAEGEKLSKSRHDTGIRELRAAGLRPAEVVALAESAVAAS